jgi:drug/metabolite transporter (DMT)-like permease
MSEHVVSDARSATPADARAIRGAGRTRWQGVLPLVAAILVWGANWPVMKLSLAHITPLWFSAMRFATGAICLVVLQAVRGDLGLPRRGDWPFVLSVGLLQMMCFTALSAIAMTALPAGRSAILSYTTQIWVAPAAILMFGEKASPLRLAGVALGAIGVAVLVNPATIPWHDARIVDASLMLLASAFCWAVCILHLRYFKSRSSAFQLAPWQMLLATSLLAIGARIEEGPFTGDGSSALCTSLFFVGALGTAFCFSAVNAASTWLPAAIVSTATLGTPVTGLALSALLLGEPLTRTLLFGSFAIVTGIALGAIPSDARRGLSYTSPTSGGWREQCVRCGAPRRTGMRLTGAASSTMPGRRTPATSKCPSAPVHGQEQVPSSCI